MVARSEGDKISRINRSEGIKTEMVNLSEGEMQSLINMAEGTASEISALAHATAESIEKVGSAIAMPGGDKAVRLDLAKRYLETFEKLAKPATKIVLPTDMTNLNEILKGMDLLV